MANCQINISHIKAKNIFKTQTKLKQKTDEQESGQFVKKVGGGNMVGSLWKKLFVEKISFESEVKKRMGDR